MYILKKIDNNFELFDNDKFISNNLDFSTLSEEEQKKIGIYYEPVIEAANRAWSYLNALGYFTTPTNEGRIVENLLIQARVRSRELLSDRKFTLEDMLNAFRAGKAFSIGSHKDFKQIHPDEKEYLQSLSQKSWKVELEMESFVEEETGDAYKWMNTRPKLTGNKVKILKLLS
jgi:hypothetical protein